MIIAAHLVPVDVNGRFMSHIIDRKTENHKKLFFVKFQNLRTISSLKMMRFFLCSVYIQEHNCKFYIHNRMFVII